MPRGYDSSTQERYSTSSGNVSIAFDFDGSYIDFEDSGTHERVRGHYSDRAWVDLQQGGWEGDWERLRHILHIQAGVPLAETTEIVAKAKQQRARWHDEIDLYFSGTRGAFRRLREISMVGGVALAILIALLTIVFWISKNVT